MTQQGKGHLSDGGHNQDGRKPSGYSPTYRSSIKQDADSKEANPRQANLFEVGGKVFEKLSQAKGNMAFSRRGFIVAGAVAATAVAGYAVFSFVGSLPFQISIDGVSQTVSVGTTYQDLIDSGLLVVETGDFLAVDGSILVVSGGNPPIIYEADKPVIDTSKAIPHDASITSVNGDDVTEETVTTAISEPYTTVIEGKGAISTLTQQGADGMQEQVAGAQSGIVVSATEITPMRPLTITAANPQPTDDKVVALTFDDGPSSYTPSILDALAAQKVKATFFTLGNQVEKYPSYSVRAVSEGHQVATHSYSHPDMFTLTPEEVRDEIQQGISALATATGITTTVLRAPYGNWSEREWAATSDLITRQVIWNVDTEDWSKPGTASIISNIMKNVKSGRIVLMHDGGGDRSEDIAALPTIITNLTTAGYRFVTVDELSAYL
jgi:peptidoglycan/xylan/chitin deacetylase (PgdA/CDA1 family)